MGIRLRVVLFPFLAFPSLIAGALDVNDDGYSDVIISAYGADKAYVFYGALTFSSSIYSMDEISGSEGFVVYAGNDGDTAAVSGAGVRTTTSDYSLHFCFNIKRRAMLHPKRSTTEHVLQTR